MLKLRIVKCIFLIDSKLLQPKIKLLNIFDNAAEVSIKSLDKTSWGGGKSYLLLWRKIKGLNFISED